MIFHFRNKRPRKNGDYFKSIGPRKMSMVPLERNLNFPGHVKILRV